MIQIKPLMSSLVTEDARSRVCDDSLVPLLHQIFSLQGQALGDQIEALRSESTLALVLPWELLSLVGLEQSAQHHAFDAWEHCKVCAMVVKGPWWMRMVALLHDALKAATLGYNPFKGLFVNPLHAKLGAESFRARYGGMAELFARYGADVKLMEALIRHHMFFLLFEENQSAPTPRAIEQLVDDIGEANLPYLFDLYEADRHASGRVSAGQAEQMRLEIETKFADLLAKLKEQRAAAAAKAVEFEKRKSLALGADVIRAVVGSGPQVKAAIAFLQRGLQDGRCENTETSLHLYLKEFRAA